MDSADFHLKLPRAAALLKAMSNQHRLAILCHLGLGERSVGELERLVGLSQSALSQHLSRLRQHGVVATRRDAQTIFYSLKGEEARRVIQTLHALYCADAAEPPEARTGEPGREMATETAPRGFAAATRLRQN